MRLVTFDGGESKNGGGKISNKERNKREPRSAECGGDYTAKNPIAVADPFTFGNEIEKKVKPAENKDGDSNVNDCLNGKTYRHEIKYNKNKRK